MGDVPARKNWGRRFIFLVVVAVFCGLMFLIYSWFAFAPTGYSTIEARQAEAVKRIAEEMRPAAGAHRANEARQPVVRIIPLQDTGWTVTQPITQQCTLSCMELGMKGGASADELVAKTRALLPQIVQADGIQQYWRGGETGPVKTDQTALIDAVEDSLLNGACDLRMIPNALGNPNRPNVYEPFESVQNGDRVLFLAADAVRRACKRNQPQKAADLLEKLTELTRQLHLNEFPNSSAHIAPLQILLMDLAHTMEFPAAGFERARAVLDRAHLDDAKLNQLKMAYIAQVGGKQLEYIRDMKIERGQSGNAAAVPKTSPSAKLNSMQYKNFQSNDYHFFMDGDVEKAGFNILKPVLMRAMEQGFVAMANGDPDGIVSAQDQVVTVCRWMNLQPPDYPVLLPLENFYAHNYYDLRNIKDDKSRIRRTLQKAAENWRESALGDKFNEQIDITRFICAYAHFLRANDRLPASAAELIPKYLDASFAADKSMVYEIAQTKPFYAVTYPRVRDQKEVQSHPFFAVLRRAYTRPTPVRVMSYDAMIGEAKTDAERKAVEDAKGPFVPERTVLCQVRAYSESRAEYMKQWQVRDDSRMTAEQKASFKKAQADAFEKIFGNKDDATFIAITTVADNPTSGTANQ
ncbi:hypothetical protein LLG95_10515 [bacterium]|nr:hypothetical protein [bacterium]